MTQTRSKKWTFESQSDVWWQYKSWVNKYGCANKMQLFIWNIFINIQYVIIVCFQNLLESSSLWNEDKDKNGQSEKKVSDRWERKANGDGCLKRESLIQQSFPVFQTFCGFKHGCSSQRSSSLWLLIWISQSNVSRSVLRAAHVPQGCSSPSFLQVGQSSSTPVESDECQPLFDHRSFSS